MTPSKAYTNTMITDGYKLMNNSTPATYAGGYVRPAITIKSNVQVKGSGTQTDPYVVIG